MRNATRTRETLETKVTVSINLDESQPPVISTGQVMFDHLLSQFAFHSNVSLHIRAQSLDAIQHHLVEDVAIVLGRALDEALANRAQIERYGSALIPMDDALVRAAADFGGRTFARTDLPLKSEQIEGLSSALVPHFFSSFAASGRIVAHIDLLAGTDPHHCVEAAFKAFARACAQAWSLTRTGIASTKGVF